MKKLVLTVCATGLIVACTPKQTVVSVPPPSQIDVEKLIDSIDYDMDVTGLSLADLRTLRHAPAAQRGYPFKDAHIRGVYHTTTWYDSLMYVLDEKMPWDKFQCGENERWSDFYYRVLDESNLMNYNQQELAFMKRLQARIEEVKKQNFEVPEDLRVNTQNLVNPNQLKDFDPELNQRLAEDGFAIVPARNDQLFQVYEKNDYQEFPNFVTTDLYLQLFHLYFDCMLREVEMYSFFAKMVGYTYDMLQVMKKIYQNAENGSALERAAEHNVRFFTIAETLFRGTTFDAGADELIAEEVQKVMNAQDSPSRFMADYPSCPQVVRLYYIGQFCHHAQNLFFYRIRQRLFHQVTNTIT